jgi:hypothetical protein
MYPPIMRTALNIGALYGLSSFAFFLFMYYAGFNALGASAWLGMWIPVVFTIWSIRYYRDHECGGYVSYWRAFRTGLLTIMCGALLSALLLYLFGLIGAPDLLDNYKEQMLKGLEETEDLMTRLFSDNVYDMMIDNINKTTMSSIASSDFFNKCCGGIILSLIAAAFLKRNPPADHIV